MGRVRLEPYGAPRYLMGSLSLAITQPIDQIHFGMVDRAINSTPNF
jgi:hypothetical protein